MLFKSKKNISTESLKKNLKFLFHLQQTYLQNPIFSEMQSFSNKKKINYFLKIKKKFR